MHNAIWLHAMFSPKISVSSFSQVYFKEMIETLLYVIICSWCMIGGYHLFVSFVCCDCVMYSACARVIRQSERPLSLFEGCDVYSTQIEIML